MKIRCAAVVHYPDGVILVRESEKAKWRLPETVMDETEDVIACIRRCVFTQTGHKTTKMRFFKIQTQAKTPKQGAFIRFIFGCELAEEPIQPSNLEVKRFRPEEVIKIASQDKCDDPFLLKLIHNYLEIITPQVKNDHVPLEVH